MIINIQRKRAIAIEENVAHNYLVSKPLSTVENLLSAA